LDFCALTVKVADVRLTMSVEKKRKSGYEDHCDEIPQAKRTHLFSANVFKKSIQGVYAITG